MEKEFVYILFAILFLAFLFFPNYGYIALRKRTHHFSKRKRAENALKFLYDNEYRKLHTTIKNIAASLNISESAAYKLAEHLRDMNLVSVSDNTVSLTEK